MKVQRRQGAGMSSGGGPSSIFSFDTEVIRPPCIQSARSPCAATLQCNASRDFLLTGGSASSRRGDDRKNVTPSNFAPVEGLAGHDRQVHRVTNVPSSRSCRAEEAATCDEANHNTAPQISVKYRMGHKSRASDCDGREDSYQDLSDSGGSNSSGHRRQGEGRSCGGGHSSICFGESGDCSSVSSLHQKYATHEAAPRKQCTEITATPPDTLKARSHVPPLRTEAPAPHLQCLKRIETGADATGFDELNSRCDLNSECKRRDKYPTHMVSSETNDVDIRPGLKSYRELASENDRLQTELDRVHAELAVFRRWFDDMADGRYKAQIPSRLVLSQ